MHIFTLTSGKTLDSVKTKIKIPNKNTRTALEKKKEKWKVALNIHLFGAKQLMT